MIRPWMLVTIGALLSIASIILNQTYISNQQQALRTQDQKISEASYLIDQTWLNIQTLESQKNAVFLMYSSPIVQGKNLFAYLQSIDTFKPHFSDVASFNKEELFKTFQETIKSLKDETIERINILYLKRKKFEDAASILEQEKQRVSNIALLLQVLGLILILAKDLAAKRR